MADTVLPAEPSSAVCARAVETVTAFSSPALVHHCRRSYLWAAAYAEARGITFDAETMFVASMLHDLGLVPAFDAHRIPFEEAGGNVAWVFGAGAGWPVERREHAARIVVDHMRDVTREEHVEGWLLMLATSWDISGSFADEWPDDLTTAVFEAYPRLDLRTEFVRCFEEQAARKPDGEAAASVASGIAQRMANHPFERDPR